MYGLTEFLKSFFFRSFIILIIFVTINFFGQIISYSILYFTLCLLFIERVYHFVKNWTYIVMPYALSFSQSAKDDSQFKNFFVDKFVLKRSIKPKGAVNKVRLKDMDSFILEYKNYISINKANYIDKADQIIHYLGLINSRYEIKVYEHKNKRVILYFYKLPNRFDMQLDLLKSGKLFLGMYSKGLYYRSLDTLDHCLVLGESGSGKSNLIQLLNINFLINYHRFKKFYMVDLKGGVELKKYENLTKVEFVNKVEQLNDILDLVLKDLEDTQDEMVTTGIRKLDDFIAIVFDEFGAISTYPDKKVRDQIFNKLALISMQGRSSGILLFMFGQKIDTTILPSSITNNLQTRVLGKTSSDYSINIIDLKENIRDRITRVEVQDFNKGRFIYKDGLTSKKDLIQVPFISDQFLDQFLSKNINYLSYEFAKL